ncbi:MAG: hypothetical protein ACT6Q5_10110, partial [Sphingopyxis solisilvae]|uniref:hypothetical protein n=1 Tax=Sphingopyxis solisilvae TaxID=1886788 RepID=UPI0040356BB1
PRRQSSPCWRCWDARKAWHGAATSPPERRPAAERLRDRNIAPGKTDKQFDYRTVAEPGTAGGADMLLGRRFGQ